MSNDSSNFHRTLSTRAHRHALRGGLLLCLAYTSAGLAATPFTGAYTQNFDTLPGSGSALAWSNDSTLPGWFLFNKTKTAITQYRAGTGSDNNGSFYSFGTSGASERALGVLVSSGTYFGSPANNEVAGWMALALKNGTASTIDALTIKYNGEMWRNGGNTNPQAMTLEYAVGDSFEGIASWKVAGDAFDWTARGANTTAGPLDGNSAGLASNRGGDLRGLQWAAGQTLWLRWVQTRISAGASHGMAIDDVSIVTTGDDTTPPALQTSNPANNATGVGLSSSIILQFNEPVRPGGGSFELRKGSTTVAAFSATDSSKVGFNGSSATISPGIQLEPNTAYSVVAVGTPVQDLSGNHWDGVALALNFTTGAQSAVTRIHDIQGSGAASPLKGQPVTINAVVTAYLPEMNGFYVQEEEAHYDSDPATSEGLFVYYGTAAGANPGVDAGSVGKRVQLTGTVDEYNQQTQLKNITDFQVQGAGVVPQPALLTLPISDMALWERYEGMLVKVSSANASGKLVVSDNYTLGRYGDVTLSPDAVLPQFTDVSLPGVEGFAEYVTSTQRSQIILDDTSGKQNPASVRGRNGQPLSAGNTLRAGDAVDAVVGVLDQFYNDKAPPEAYQTSYRVQPTQPLDFKGGERPTAADLKNAVGAANVKVASANVLNFFSKVGDTSTNTKDVFTTPLGNSIGIRGANNTAELERQKTKVVANLIGLDADVYGLMEVQNNGFGNDSAIKLLVDAMNASADRPAGAVYDYVKAPFKQGAGSTVAGAGTDAITVAIVYRSDRVKPVGQAAAPDVATYDAFTPNGGGARVPIAQTFSANTPAGEEQFTFVVNHFKSKGSLLATGGNADKQDGQGNNNPARVKTATQLKEWLATQPTGAETANVILVGDFNAYAKEDPVTYLESNGFKKVTQGYSYSFKGLWGSLDHIFVSPALQSKVGKAVKWAINAEEPTVLDYNTEYKTPEQVQSYYAATAYRSSDHNPIVLGLNLGALPVNHPPVIHGVPDAATQITAGKPVSLAGITLEDADGDALALTVTTTNGSVQGLTDADAGQPGIQLSGTAAQIGTQLAASTFTAAAEGTASVGLSLSDGTHPAVVANYAFTVAAAPTNGHGTDFSLSPVANVNVKGELSGAGCQLASPPQYVTPASVGVTAMPSDGATLPHGLLTLNATGCDKGGTLTVKMTYADALPKGTEYWKWGRTADNGNKHWYRIPATVAGNVVTFALKDGGLGDDDLVENGNIADPTALVLPKATTPTTPADTVAVPALNAWGLLMLALSFLPFAPLVQRFSRKHR